MNNGASESAAIDALESSGPVMPFTFRDVARHTWTILAAFMVFVVGYAVFSAFTMGGDMYGASIVCFAGFITLILVWLGAPFAWLLGRALRQVPFPAVHLSAFGLLGAGAGALIASSGILQVTWQSTAVVAGISGVCTIIGRYVAYRSRKRDGDAPGIKPRHIDHARQS
ncbi:hypothetical protein [Microbacterium terricola]|uniref:Uncharacterized protein n=1 Tax=Microbacterium terricola TaxID=344163 RepID=A0ABM8E2C9_9MICO|nr:hypothetical protein [Microbacterium terricola]UYK40337.1 hypothetical protein OAU46_01410 [Microbacterium terricola]BDV31949.1 hypothetical protein Microterr_26090 [Microbacterium terricola]